jgi:hypothetical protein
MNNKKCKIKISVADLHRSNKEKSPQNRIAYLKITRPIFGYLCPICGDLKAILWRVLTKNRISVCGKLESRFLNRRRRLYWPISN